MHYVGRSKADPLLPPTSHRPTVFKPCSECSLQSFSDKTQFSASRVKDLIVDRRQHGLLSALWHPCVFKVGLMGVEAFREDRKACCT